MAFKSNLQAMRKRAGFKSAREFAEHMDVNVSTYTKYEQGTAMMSLLQAWEFADALNCTLDELAGRRVPEQSQITANEQRILNVYRLADERGKDNIDCAIDREARYMDETAKGEARDA